MVFGSRPGIRSSVWSSLRLGAVAAGVFAGAAVLGATGLGVEKRATEGLPIRVGIAVAVDTPLVVGSATGARLLDASTGERLFHSSEPVELHAERHGPLVAVTSTGTGGGSREPRGATYSVRVEPAGEAPLTLGGSPYRGAIEVYAVEESGLNAVNELPLEDYLLGVVPIEIGPREPDEVAAVAAQAVAARTYAVSHLRAREEMGFDLFGTVEDQAYGGMAAERDEATRAVRATAGRVLMYDGLPIRAMYHSTCGGRTAPVEDVLDREPAPYLKSVADRAPDGTDYCAISPRYRWVEELTPRDLNGRIRSQVRRIFGAPAEHTGELLGVRIAERTTTGRVRALALRGTRSEFVLERLDIRIALQNDEGRILGSTDFDIAVRPDDVIELRGRGFGHGSGMCQWGAIGRARAGQDWETILSTYYPGAELVSIY